MPDNFYFGFSECFGGAPEKWEELVSSGRFTVVTALRYPDRMDGLLFFDRGTFDFFKTLLDFEKRSVYAVFNEDGCIFQITKDSAQSVADETGKLNFRRIAAKFKRRKQRLAREADRQKDDVKRCAGFDGNRILKNGSALWYPSFKRDLFFRADDRCCTRFFLHSPKGSGPYPLILFFHGASLGISVIDDIQPIFEVRNLWLRLKKQKRDCFILALKRGYDEFYNTDRHSEILRELTELVIREAGNIDVSRIYLAGVSYGGHAAIYEAFRHPDRYAGAVPTVGWTYLDGDRQVDFLRFKEDKYHSPFDAAGIEELAKTPLWLACSHKELEFNEPLYKTLKDAGADVRFTRNDRRGHQMHAAFFRKQPWDDWLFEKTKKQTSDCLKGETV